MSDRLNTTLAALALIASSLAASPAQAAGNLLTIPVPKRAT